MAQDLDARAAVFAALGEPVRLALVDRLVVGDASPGELAAAVGLGSNLLAHHLRVLEDAGIIRRVSLKVIGDAATSNYARPADRLGGRPLRPHAQQPPDRSRLVFVCTANSARSQLAAAIWNQLRNIPATSAGTHPGPTDSPAGRRRCRAPRTPHRSQPAQGARRRPSRR